MTPSIPGINRYPNLAKQFQQAIQRAKKGSCDKCNTSQIVTRFRKKLERCKERDNSR